ncbi:hypothetical protein HHK36_005760 [Tetracentron sinense]|uniref:Cystatin domain-containing protein n=1 Tax=Tetracentron sinense TaxID=13715 RepID=A0A835DN47_TETSI|nr:hypothetical protein HHK36_005760 [Tetracentron sinense]
MEIQRHFSFQLPLLYIFLFILNTNVATTDTITAGDWNEIPDVLNNTHIQDLGMFVVLSYNNSTGSNLSFYAVFEAQAQIVAGLNFRLVLQALEVDFPKMYKAYLWEKPWEGFKNLTSFEPVLG